MKNASTTFIAMFLLIGTSEIFGAEFYNLGQIPGYTDNCMSNGVSSDGSVVVGYGSYQLTQANAFRWSLSGGMVNLGDFPGGMNYSCAYGISADGVYTVGRASSSSGGNAFRWSSAQGMVSLGTMTGGNYSIANSTSADGSVVVGAGDSTAGQQAFRWTASGGMVGLGFLPGGSYSQANGVSANGNVIVGDATSTSSSMGQAFRWTSSGGLVPLGLLSGGSYSHASAVSADGSTAVGYGDTASGEFAFYWNGTSGMTQLGSIPGLTASYASGVSGDGSIIVGNYVLNNMDIGGFIWDRTSGMRDIKTVLSNDYGIDLTGWSIFYPTSISANGRAICGSGIGPSGIGVSWLALLDPYTLNWRKASSGDWETRSNWDFAHPATSMTDVYIQPSSGLTVTGPMSATTIKSLTVGSLNGIATLRLQLEGTVNVTGTTTIQSRGKIAGTGYFNSAEGIYNYGEIDLGDEQVELSGGVLVNGGVIRGSGTIGNSLENAGGQVRLALGERMLFSGSSNMNAGSIQVLGGELELEQGLLNSNDGGVCYARGATLRFGGDGLANLGTFGITFGTTDVFGKVENDISGKIMITGNSNITFYDDVTNYGLLKVSAGSTAVFFGDLLGNATEGSGTIYIESGSDGGGGGGKVLLAGAPTETNSTSHRVTVINTAANGLQVSSGNYTIGRLYGSGTVFIDEDAILCIANQVDSGAITVADGGGVIFGTPYFMATCPIAENGAEPSAVAVPEPSSILLMIMAAIVAMDAIYRRK